MLVPNGRSRASLVVRLKGGDPYVFGRGDEEASALAEAGVPFEVVPGVTSALAALSYAGVPAAGRLRRFDVALYRSGGRYVLHRVVRVLPSGYVIIGDNCITEEHVEDAQVQGVRDDDDGHGALEHTQARDAPRAVPERGACPGPQLADWAVGLDEGPAGAPAARGARALAGFGSAG